nr:MAG TPA: hypothetical protein [Bacteriophage sp.]
MLKETCNHRYDVTPDRTGLIFFCSKWLNGLRNPFARGDDFGSFAV